MDESTAACSPDSEADSEAASVAGQRTRARDLGIVVGYGTPGAMNAITDVAGMRVGHCSLISGHGRLIVGEGPVRTGVTVVLPGPEPWTSPVYAGCHRLNGNGELTGLEWVRESGLLTSPIGLTNTQSVGAVRDGLVRAEVAARGQGLYWSLPVVGETWDGLLNDVHGLHVRPDHVLQALADAATGPVAEGSVGSGVGMICHGFKGGIGTASRVIPDHEGGFTVGALVQANHGRRERLTINGAPVGQYLTPQAVALPEPSEAGQQPTGGGSIIVVIATDAPLLPHQCQRLAQRAVIGIARTGGTGEHYSGDLIVAFATGNRLAQNSYGHPGRLAYDVRTVGDPHLDALFDAAAESTEEAIVNCLIAAQTVTGRDDITAHAIPHEPLLEILDRHQLRSPYVHVQSRDDS
jgi:D-aminopeptidase